MHLVQYGIFLLAQELYVPETGSSLRLEQLSIESAALVAEGIACIV
jgi:hypothetical protein